MTWRKRRREEENGFYPATHALIMPEENKRRMLIGWNSAIACLGVVDDKMSTQIKRVFVSGGSLHKSIWWYQAKKLIRIFDRGGAYLF